MHSESKAHNTNRIKNTLRNEIFIRIFLLTQNKNAFVFLYLACSIHKVSQKHFPALSICVRMRTIFCITIQQWIVYKYFCTNRCFLHFSMWIQHFWQCYLNGHGKNKEKGKRTSTRVFTCYIHSSWKLLLINESDRTQNNKRVFVMSHCHFHMVFR